MTLLQCWVVYILRCGDDSLYTGITNNLSARLRSHNRGKGSKYVRSRLPAELVFSYTVTSKSAALRLEALVKRQPKRVKEKLVAGLTTLEDLQCRTL